MNTYKKYTLMLDSADADDQKFISFLESRHGKKRKHSYSAILKRALALMMAEEQEDSLKALGAKNTK